MYIKKPRNLSTQTEVVRIVRVLNLHYNHEATSYRLDDWIIAEGQYLAPWRLSHGPIAQWLVSLGHCP